MHGTNHARFLGIPTSQHLVDRDYDQTPDGALHFLQRLARQPLLTMYKVVLCCHHQVRTGKLGSGLLAWMNARNEYWGAEDAKLLRLSVVCM